MEIKYVIIDCLLFNYMDLIGMLVFFVVVKEYKFVGIEVLLVRCINSFLVLMNRLEFLEMVGKEYVFFDIVDVIIVMVLDNY